MIICYAPQSAKTDALLEELSGYSLLRAGKSHLSMTMDAIAAQNKPDFADPGSSSFLYWIDENPEAIFALQRKMKEKGMEECLMAVRTENNRSWKLADLLDEVSTEAAYFHKRDRIHDLLASFSMDVLMANPSLFNSARMAYALLKDDNAPADLLDTVIDYLEAVSARYAGTGPKAEEKQPSGDEEKETR